MLRRAAPTLVLLATILLATATVGAAQAPGPAAAPGPPAARGSANLLAAPSGVVWSGPSTSELFRSTDGGGRWKVVLNGEDLGASYFLAVDDAWVVKQNIHGDGVGETTTVYSTTDGGTHWYHSKAPNCGWLATTASSTADAWALFSGPQSKQGLETSVLYMTHDGGATWTRASTLSWP